MCNFLSGVVTLEREPRVLCGDLHHHERTVEIYHLIPETYREFEWTLDDEGRSLSVRAAPGENPAVLKAAILARFRTRAEMLDSAIRQIQDLGGNLDLRGTQITQLPHGLSAERVIR